MENQGVKPVNSKKHNGHYITPDKVHEVLSQNILADGMDIVLDLKRSRQAKVFDAKTGKEHLDFFSFFATSPVGLNHPKINNDEFKAELAEVATTKPSNSDIYTVQMAEFVDTFARIAKPEHFKYLFFIDGGALAVENGLKAAFDWKVRKNFQKGYKEEKGHQVLHFREAFHGRTGYTMSLTNTDPNKVAYFPKFNWPRIDNPKIKFPLEDNLEEVKKAEEKAIKQIHEAIANNPDDIAVMIIEPIQGEGGDNFFRKEFLQELRKIADENEILLMFDEVQSGFGLTGKMWAHQHYVNPDIVSFGKKTQICGIMVSDRIDEVENNTFHKASRLNSTWGGNLTDMVRSKKFMEIIEEEDLVENARKLGEYLLNQLHSIQQDFPELISQPRGLGLMCSFDFPSGAVRDKFLKELHNNRVLMLGNGPKSVRFRPPLDITQSDIDEGLQIIRNVLYSKKDN